jgi:hypothetical protein
LWLAAVMVLAAIAVYVVHDPLGPPNGGTWLGYTLGSLGAVLIVWLMWFGIRKRRYGSGSLNLQEWLSAHVYLGIALIAIATLHAGFQFGWNIHTLAYALMIVVVLSGLYGVFTYLRYPSRLTRNRDDSTLESIFLEIANLDQQCRSISHQLDDDTAAIILDSCRAKVGGGAFRQLSGADPSCPAMRASTAIEGRAAMASGDETLKFAELSALLSKKCELLKRARSDVRMQAMMKVWLFVHLPVSFALLAALAAHIFSVFYYW